MKKSFLIFIPLFFCFSFQAQSQFKKGNRMAGANVGSIFYNNGNVDVTYPAPTQGYSYNNNSFGLNIVPSMGWFISDNTAIGISLNVNPSSFKNTYEVSGTTYKKDKSTPFNIGIGGFARNYFGNSSSYMPFGQISLNFGISTQKTEGFLYGGNSSGAYKETYEGKSSGGFFSNAGLTLGLTKLLNPHTSLDIFAGYNFSYSKNTMKTTTLRDDGINGSVDVTSIAEPTTKYTNHGFTIGAGFQVFLDARK